MAEHIRPLERLQSACTAAAVTSSRLLVTGRVLHGRRDRRGVEQFADLRQVSVIRMSVARRGTEHGRVIATIAPAMGESRIEQLVAAGLVTLPRGERRPLPTPIAIEGSVSDLVADQRR